VLLLLFAGKVGADPSRSDTTTEHDVRKTRPEPAVRTAPGGGDMIFLGSDARYVLRARVHRDKVDVQCTRDGASEHDEDELK
jgi:hypothetical protein